MKAAVTWISDWRHALIALAFGALAIVAAVFVPESRWEKLGLLVERIAEDPAGFVVLIGVIGGAITTLRGAWMRTPPPAALVLLALLPFLGGCGASALRTHATIATVASVAVASAAPAVPAACDAALTSCDGAQPCVDETAERCRVAARATDGLVAAVRGYVDAVEVATYADEGQTLPALLAAWQGLVRLWPSVVAALGALGVTVPTLPAVTP